MVSRRCAKSIGPTEILRRRAVASSTRARDVLRCWPLCGEGGRSTARILDAAVVAVATDCLGRELRKLGDSLAAGADTYALSRPLPAVVEMFEGGGFRVDPDVVCAVWLGVLVTAAGVADRLVGVLARAAALPCCLDVRPLVDVCFIVAGEFDRVELGLVGPDAWLILLLSTGRRDVGDVGEVGDMGDASPLLCLAAACWNRGFARIG